jgi:hypothetical protein
MPEPSEDHGKDQEEHDEHETTDEEDHATAASSG